MLQRLQEDLPAQYIYTMLARQVRLLIMAREVLEAGGGQNEMASQAGLNPFVAKKALAQCRHFFYGFLQVVFAKGVLPGAGGFEHGIGPEGFGYSQ